MSRLADFLWHVMTHGSPTVWNMRRTKWQKLSKDIQTQHSVEVTSTGCVRVSNFLETRVSLQLCPCDWQFAPISGHIVLKHIKYSECADDEGPQFPCAGHKATYLWSLPLRTLLHTLPLKLETRENFNQACCIVQWWKSPNIHISSFTVKGISQRPSETPDKATAELEQQARWPLGSGSQSCLWLCQLILLAPDDQELCPSSPMLLVFMDVTWRLRTVTTFSSSDHLSWMLFIWLFNVFFLFMLETAPWNSCSFHSISFLNLH